MRKYIISLLILLVSCSFTLATEDSTFSIVKDQIDNNTPIVKKLPNCTPTKGKYYAIYGIKNDKCHFKTETSDCLVPIDVTKKYANSLLKGYQQILSTGNVFVFNSDAEYVDMVHEKYCTYR